MQVGQLVQYIQGARLLIFNIVLILPLATKGSEVGRRPGHEQLCSCDAGEFSGYECGRVFPAGVGPGSPSRDTAIWLPSRFSLSAEMRRRFGWLRMVFPGARLVQAPILCPSGGVVARERQGSPSRRAW